MRIQALRPDPAADPVAGLENDHVMAGVRHHGRGGEPGKARPYHANSHVKPLRSAYESILTGAPERVNPLKLRVRGPVAAC
jgi:hypothetical protein